MAVVETERHGQVLVVRMNRPDRLNALNTEMRAELAQAWTDFRHSKELEVAIFTGAGRGFCAGEDMKESLQNGAPGGERPKMEDPFMTGALEKPVIAAVNGTAAGGGVAMVLACDLVIAAEHARLIQVFVRRGLIPDGGPTYLLPRNVGLQKAKELVFFGDDLPAAEAERIGLVNKVVPGADLETTAREWAERLAQGPTKTIGYAKRLLNRSLDVDRATLFEEEAMMVELVTGTADSAEGVASFRERRPTEFKGY